MAPLIKASTKILVCPFFLALLCKTKTLDIILSPPLIAFIIQKNKELKQSQFLISSISFTYLKVHVIKQQTLQYNNYFDPCANKQNSFFGFFVHVVSKQFF